MSIGHDSGECGFCSGYHPFNTLTDEFEDCACGCTYYPDCNFELGVDEE